MIDSKPLGHRLRDDRVEPEVGTSSRPRGSPPGIVDIPRQVRHSVSVVPSDRKKKPMTTIPRTDAEINERNKTLYLADRLTLLILGDAWTLDLHRQVKRSILEDAELAANEAAR